MTDAWPLYLWQSPDWPHWRYDLPALVGTLVAVSRAHGELLGRLADVGMTLRTEASLATLTQEVMQTSAIEGETLDTVSVRSSMARRLGIETGVLGPVDREVEGIVEIVLDATRRAFEPVTAERLHGWHAALFPTGRSGLHRIRVGDWRDDRQGPMQVVSGPIERPVVHFEAPPAPWLPPEIARFLDWLDGPATEPPLIRAGLGHLWFVTLHPFDDGNGRIGRALGELLLARADGGVGTQRFYSLSAQIKRRQKSYYQILERTSKGTLDVTAWLAWFLETLGQAIEQAHGALSQVLDKARFWRAVTGVPMNPRQIRVLNRLLDGLNSKLTTSKWAALAKCSTDTALRDINELVSRQVLRKMEGGGRSTAYGLSVTSGSDHRLSHRVDSTKT